MFLRIVSLETEFMVVSGTPGTKTNNSGEQLGSNYAGFAL
jgi:hypothetical protein